MTSSTKEFSAEQLKAIAELQQILQTLKNQKVHIAGIHDYEVHIYKDSSEQTYISIT